MENTAKAGNENTAAIELIESLWSAAPNTFKQLAVCLYYYVEFKAMTMLLRDCYSIVYYSIN